MNRWLFAIAVLAMVAASATGLEWGPNARPQTEKKKFHFDPINDMFGIKRECSTPYVSDELSDKERKMLEQSWHEQFREAEELHREMKREWKKRNERNRRWVLY